MYPALPLLYVISNAFSILKSKFLKHLKFPEATKVRQKASRESKDASGIEVEFRVGSVAYNACPHFSRTEIQVLLGLVSIAGFDEKEREMITSVSGTRLSQVLPEINVFSVYTFFK